METIAVNDVVNLKEKISKLQEAYSPGIVAFLNDYKVLMAKMQGEFVWHKHDDTDELFLVVQGALTIHLRDRSVELREGDLYIVPRGTEHCPAADQAAYVLLIEPQATVNTGDTGGSRTVEPVVI